MRLEAGGLCEESDARELDASRCADEHHWTNVLNIRMRVSLRIHVRIVTNSSAARGAHISDSVRYSTRYEGVGRFF